MSPWWSRPTSDGDKDAPGEPSSAKYEPASISQHTDAVPVENEPDGEPERRGSAPPRDSHASADSRGSEQAEASPLDDPWSAPRAAWSEQPDDEHDADAPGEGDLADQEGDAELEADADGEAEGDGDGEGDAEGAEGEGARTGEGAERRRRRRGGRRRRRSSGNGTATAPEGAAVAGPAGASTSPAPVGLPMVPAAEPAERGVRRERFVEAAPSVASLAFTASPTVDYERLAREIVVSIPERAAQQSSDERKIALFCDLENVALGVRDSDIKKFDIELVLERLLEKGKIIVKKAYADWERYSDYKRAFHESAIELIDIPQKFYSGKNSADIKMVVDAMDLSYSKDHLDTFVILSGDSDFSPLVSKLKENNKYVIGIGVKNSSSNLLIDNCDEFIFYEDVWRDQQQTPVLEGISKKQAEAFNLMGDAIQALQRENKDVLWGSMIKQTMKRKKPSFNESYYGYSTFSELLHDAEKKGLIKVRKDQRSGSLIVTGLSSPGR